MSENDIAMLRGELNTLKEVMNEKWSSHDKRSDERWADLMEQFHSMARKFDDRPCKDHVELMANLNARLIALEKEQDSIGSKLWAVLLMVVGSVIAAIFSLFK